MTKYSAEKRILQFRKKFTQRGPDDCWNWKAATLGLRVKYGAFWDGTNVIPAHRFSYIIHVGEIPKGVLICHKCDNPLCVNPNHFFLGSYLDNNRDMVAKGRAARKLTIEDVIFIRKSKDRHCNLARKFHVSAQMILRVRKRLAWNHVA